MPNPYLEDVYPEVDEKEFHPATDILEIMADEQPGGGDTVGLEASEATLVYIIDWRKQRSFARFMLGFSYADKETPYKLHRENPQQHPTKGTLTALTINFSSQAPKANTEDGVPGTDNPAFPNGVPNYPAIYPGEKISKTGYYEKCWATVRFVQQMWTFRPDERIATHTDEIWRNCYFDPVPNVDLLQAEGGTSQLKWSEGRTPTGGSTSPGSPATAPISGTVIGNQFATQVAKVVYTLNWMWVAEAYLSNDPLLFFPVNLFSRNTYVNSVPFAGRPAGTMLMLAPQLQRFRFPIATYDGLNPFYGWNIKIPFVYFNPEKGIPETAANYPGIPTDDIPRGHRLMPNRIDGLWYEAKRENKTSHLLLEADLNDIFRHVSDPP